MNYEELSKEQLIAILKDKNVYSDFKAEISTATTRKELDGVFIRMIEKSGNNTLLMSEFKQLKEILTQRYEEIKTKEEKLREELVRLSFLQQFKVTEKLSDDEEWRGDTLYCKKCGGKRSIYWNEYEKAMRILCDCQAKEKEEQEEQKRIATIKQRNLQKLEGIGINANNYGFEKFKVTHDWQRKMLECAKDFLNDTNKGIIFTGQSGAGKTHLLNSVVIELIEKGINVEYLKWLEHGKFLKSIINDTEKYQAYLNRYKNVQVLYIDDFLKVGKNGIPTDADISLAFEILDYRKENKLATMISSERNLAEIISIDEATGGRIIELCKIRFELKDFKNVENYRLKM